MPEGRGAGGRRGGEDRVLGWQSGPVAVWRRGRKGDAEWYSGPVAVWRRGHKGDAEWYSGQWRCGAGGTHKVAKGEQGTKSLNLAKLGR